MLRALRVIKAGWRERLGKGVIEKVGSGPYLWFHAASVGEVSLSLALMEGLRPHLPSPFLLTAMTPEGRSLAERSPLVEVALFAPLDLKWVVRRFIRGIEAKGLLVAETELWPNMIMEAKRSSLPLLLFNGRISRDSYRLYRSFRPLFSRVIRSFDMILARTEEDRERFIGLGAQEEKVQVTGDLKFYQALMGRVPEDEVEELRGELPRSRLFVCGSTHRGEEEVLLEVFGELRRRFPDLLLILAPRHPERAKEVERLAQGKGLRVSRRSQGPGGGWDVLVLDTVGELRRFYAVGDLVFVGGSIVKGIGGHNVLEVLAQGKGVIFGPHMENFAEVRRAVLQEGVGVEVKGKGELVSACERFLSSPEEGKEMGSRGYALLKERGERAFSLTLQAIETVLQ